jgi:hypothetical protein
VRDLRTGVIDLAKDQRSGGARSGAGRRRVGIRPAAQTPGEYIGTVGAAGASDCHREPARVEASGLGFGCAIAEDEARTAHLVALLVREGNGTIPVSKAPAIVNNYDFIIAPESERRKDRRAGRAARRNPRTRQD